MPVVASAAVWLIKILEGKATIDREAAADRQMLDHIAHRSDDPGPLMTVYTGIGHWEITVPGC